MYSPALNNEVSINSLDELERIYELLMKDPSIPTMLRKFVSPQGMSKGKTVEDIMSESFIKLSKYALANNQQDIQILKPYFITICRNMIFANSRDKSKEQRISDETILLDLVDNNHDNGLSNEERDNLLQQALKQLSAKCKERIMLRFVGKLKSKEIALKTGMSSAKKVDDFMSLCYKKFRVIIRNTPAFFPLVDHQRTKK